MSATVRDRTEVAIGLVCPLSRHVQPMILNDLEYHFSC